MNKSNVLNIFLVGLFSFGLFSFSSFSKTTYITIGTGGVTGVYYPTGGAIAKIINEKKKTYNIRASVESTAGSVFNANSLESGDIEFGIVQSDRQYQAVNGLAEWKEKGPQKKLRAICSIHAEAVTLVATEKSKVFNITDLKGKRVNIGNPGSGQRGNSIDILNTAGIDYEKDIMAEGLKAAEAPKMLQDGRIDAFFYTVGHPSGAITEATAGKQKVRFVAVTGMDKLLATFPYYAQTMIPTAAYPQALNEKDTPTVGVKATLMTSSDVSAETVYAVTKELFENLKEFKTLHPAFASLTKESMLEAISAPIHEGAMKYYKESGLDKSLPSKPGLR